jgi:glycine cleavage system H protein
MYPADYRYTKEHEWVKVTEGVGTIGITFHAQKELGDVVFVELPQPGAHFDASQPFGTVESVKAVSDLYCPVAGSVAEINTALADNPALVNEDPHGKAWLIKLKLDDPKAADGLLTAAQYEEFVRESEETQA